VVEDRRLGVMGELHPQVQAQFSHLEAPLAAAELDLGILLKSTADAFDVQPVKPYPPVLEDLAVVVPNEIPAGQVEDLIWKAGGKLLTGVQLFDVYQGEQIGQGMKSLAYSLVYQAADRTLTDDEAARVREKIIARLEKELGARLRA
jgi:phenylalanyl-tRNA synthetase beta chain